MKAETLVHELLRRGADFFTGVPCSFIKPLINYVIDSPECRYVPATIEGEAVAIAAGAYLCGKKPVIMLQNSGLGNTVNPITSLLSVYRIPALFIVTWRAGPALTDAPQHTIMGKITPDLLALLGIRYAVLEDDPAHLQSILDDANECMEVERAPFALIVRKDVIEKHPLQSQLNYRRDRIFSARTVGDSGPPPSRDDVMREIVPVLEGVPVVATTGFTSRALFNAGDRASNFYMQGSMGFAASIALGVSLCRETHTVVIDGDGSLLMRMSVLFTLGAFHRRNLVYILLDNNVHDSTGGQTTISSNVKFDRLADAAGFDSFEEVRSAGLLAVSVKSALAAPALTFLYVRTAPGEGARMDRPDLAPAQIAERFREFVCALPEARA